jgi:putative DNA methylase
MVLVKSPKKLIEVALPLNAINVAAAREKSIKHGHPSTLHIWWARRPLAAARAVIFAQLVNDPSWKWEMENSGKVPPNNLKATWAKSRNRLFRIIEDLVKWENTTNQIVLEKAREEIRKSWREVCELNKEHPQAAELFNPEKLPALHDPFAGGGTIPFEAQRLGLEAYASDLNPVAVLINKAMIEIPPKFTGSVPVGPISESEQGGNLGFMSEWLGATGLAEDVRRYGAWMREEAFKKIGHLYPKIKVTDEMAIDRPDLKPLVGKELMVTAWLWARTVKSPNPAFAHVDVPLASTFVLSSKEGKEVYVEPVIEDDKYKFTVKIGKPPDKLNSGTTAGKRSAFICLMSDVPIDYNYIRSEGKAGRMGQKLMAIVAEGKRGRVYLEPTSEMEDVAVNAKPTWKSDMKLPDNPRDFKTWNYGLTTFGDLFTSRQLVALTTFSDLISEVCKKIKEDVINSGLVDDKIGLESGGKGATAYAEAISVYLSFALSKLLDRSCSLVTWFPERDSTYHVFGRQALPMTWDFAETNTLGVETGSFLNAIKWEAEVIESFNLTQSAFAFQAKAQDQKISLNKIISTDPPYYDNIGYADLSDFFYVWLRRSLKSVFPLLFSTIAVPKAEELVATPYRHGSKEKAENFFLEGMTLAMSSLSNLAHSSFPITIYYAFKQSETKNELGTSSSGWETFLSAIINSGFSICGTWPMRTELGNRLIGKNSNALASSIVLVCRKRYANAPTVSRREFIRELNQILPEALDEMTKGSGDDQSPVAPVDLSQAIIGPGMAVFSKYSAVLEADGTPMKVKTALQLINRFLAEDDFDHDTQFCLHWFDQYGWNEGAFGEADVLSRSKATSVSGLEEAGVLFSKGGKVRLRNWNEYPSEWNPVTDNRFPVWEALHQMIRIIRNDGETAAGKVLAQNKIRSMAESVRQLSYRLYTLCERKGWADDARAYNELITSWAAIETASGTFEHVQGDMFEN